MELELLRIIIAIVGSGIAAWYDMFNKKNIPTTFLYAFLGLSLFINLFDPTSFLAHLPTAALIMIALYLFYRLGQLGGADVLIFASIYSALPVISEPLIDIAKKSYEYPLELTAFQPQVFQLPSIIPILAIAAFLFFIGMCIKYIPFIIAKMRKRTLDIKFKNILQCIVIFAAYTFMIYTLFTSPLAPFITLPYLLLFILMLFFICFFILFREDIINSMIVWKSSKTLEQEDVLALEQLDAAIIERYKLGRLITADQLKKMRKIRAKWPVLDLPMFVPFIFTALLIYVIFGDPILYLL